MIGTTIGDWKIEEELSKDEVGRLYRTESLTQPGLQTVLKLLTHPQAKSESFVRHFLAQITLIRKLKHPCIVEVYEGGDFGGVPYFVSERVEGSDFEAIMRTGEKFQWREVLVIALHCLAALRYAHRRGVLHRNLKPANLLRSPDGNYRLRDFGVTKFFDENLYTNSDNILGGAAYLTPETCAGKPHTKRSDFYSLGCLLYTLLGGRPPFIGATMVELTHKHCYVLPERVIHFVPQLPEEFDRIIMKLLSKDPAQRPGSGTLLIHELELFAKEAERRGLIDKRPVITHLLDNEPLAVDADAEPVRKSEPIPQLPRPWFKRWYFVLPGFCACVLFALWAFWWRGPTADELLMNAQPLLQSSSPEDWEKAWNEYLEPLNRKYPNRYKDEVRQTKQRIEAYTELKKAILNAKNLHYSGQAERFYHLGNRLLQNGEITSAREIWTDMILVFGSIKQDDPWVAAARIALTRLEESQLSNKTTTIPAEVENTLKSIEHEIQKLRQTGKGDQADRLSQALENLYHNEFKMQQGRTKALPNKSTSP